MTAVLADVDGDTAEQRRRLPMPAILTRDGDHAMRASPARNKRRQKCGDAERDAETGNESNGVA